LASPELSGTVVRTLVEFDRLSREYALEGFFDANPYRLLLKRHLPIITVGCG
jgi:hypothetical protein